MVDKSSLNCPLPMVNDWNNPCFLYKQYYFITGIKNVWVLCLPFQIILMKKMKYPLKKSSENEIEKEWNWKA